VIGQSGITYDQNGNATGQVGLGNAVPSWGAQPYTVGTAGVSLDYYWFEYASSFGMLSGGNPSGNWTYVFNLGQAESVPMFDLPSKVPGCQLGANKPDLGGATRAKYDTARNNLLAYLTGLSPQSTCGHFLNNRPQISLAKAIGAVTNQKPFDGPGSTISSFTAGAYRQKDNTNLAKAKEVPVCAIFWKGMSWNGVGALAQAQPPATDVYVATQPSALMYLGKATVLHESLHNLTGLGDDDLYNLLTGNRLKGKPSGAINDELLKDLCAQFKFQ